MQVTGVIRRSWKWRKWELEGKERKKEREDDFLFNTSVYRLFPEKLSGRKIYSSKEERRKEGRREREESEGKEREKEDDTLVLFLFRVTIQTWMKLE